MFRATALVAGAIVMAWLYRELTRWVARRAERRRRRELREQLIEQWYVENLLDPELQAAYEQALHEAEEMMLVDDLELLYHCPSAWACPVEEQN